jgi:integrase
LSLHQDEDFVFASPYKKGLQPYWPTLAWRNTSEPAAKRASISKRIGWHTFRYTFGTLVNEGATVVATIKELMRHANVSITMDRYVQAVTPAKRKAQSSVVSLLAPRG